MYLHIYIYIKRKHFSAVLEGDLPTYFFLCLYHSPNQSVWYKWKSFQYPNDSAIKNPHCASS